MCSSDQGIGILQGDASLGAGQGMSKHIHIYTRTHIQQMGLSLGIWAAGGHLAHFTHM